MAAEGNARPAPVRVARCTWPRLATKARAALTRRGRGGAVDSRRETNTRGASLARRVDDSGAAHRGGHGPACFRCRRNVHAYIGRFAAAFMVSWWIWAGITPVVRAAMRRVPFERPWMRPLAMHALLALTAALLFSLWFTWVIWLSRPPTLPPQSYSAAFRRFVMGHTLAGIAIYATIVAVSTTIDERAARRRRELDTARLEADLAQAQLRALQMQLQPHFLFNTLHAIAMLTDRTRRPPRPWR